MSIMSNLETNGQDNVDKNQALVDLIMKEAHLSNLPDADRKYVQANLSLQIDRRLGLIIMENLNDEGREEYTKLLEDGLVPNQEKLQVLLDKYVPDYQEKIKVGLDKFIKEAIASLSK